MLWIILAVSVVAIQVGYIVYRRFHSGIKVTQVFDSLGEADMVTFLLCGVENSTCELFQRHLASILALGSDVFVLDYDFDFTQSETAARKLARFVDAVSTDYEKVGIQAVSCGVCVFADMLGWMSAKNQAKVVFTSLDGVMTNRDVKNPMVRSRKPLVRLALYLLYGVSFLWIVDLIGTIVMRAAHIAGCKTENGRSDVQAGDNLLYKRIVDKASRQKIVFSKFVAQVVFMARPVKPRPSIAAFYNVLSSDDGFVDNRVQPDSVRATVGFSEYDERMLPTGHSTLFMRYPWRDGFFDNVDKAKPLPEESAAEPDEEEDFTSQDAESAGDASSDVGRAWNTWPIQQ